MRLIIVLIFLCAVCYCEVFQTKKAPQNNQQLIINEFYDNSILEEIKTLVVNFSNERGFDFNEDKKEYGTITFYLKRKDTTKKIGEQIEILLTMMFIKRGVVYKVKITAEKMTSDRKLRSIKKLQFKTNDKEKLLTQLEASLTSLGN